MSYQETLEYIHSVKWQGSKPGLSRTRELLSKLGNPEKKLRFVHIAGTNGKGSTAACIASVLKQAGYKTGLYTSPYINKFNERMQVNGDQISDAELEELTNEIRPHAESMKDLPTEFELITALAMRFFEYKQCDVVVLEVGMGGELDSTNVIDVPDVAVITAIGLDHTKDLGPSLGDIAMAKAGIIKKGGTVAIYGGPEEVLSVFQNVCDEKDADLYLADFSALKIRKCDLTGCTFNYGELRNLFLPLAGTYQPYNAALAITALKLSCTKGYRISNEDIISGISNVKWPGRFEIISEDPVVILDGAHNPHGIIATAQSLKDHFGDKKIVFVLGVMADKDVKNMISHIAPLAKCFVAVKPENPRAMEPEALAKIFVECGLNAYPSNSIVEGVAKAFVLSGSNGIICALGSLYFSNDIRTAVKKAKNATTL